MQKYSLSILSLLAFISLTVWAFVFSKPDNRLHIYFLNIGQGDAIYTRTPDGRDILVDGGGGDNKVLTELGSIMPFNDKEINLMVATHPDADHIGGLKSVLERYQVDEIWINGAIHTTDTYLKFLDAVKKEQELGAMVKVVTRGERKDWNQTSLLVYAPLESFEGKQPKEQNEGTIVARLVYNKISILLTGDLEFALEDRLFANSNDIYPLTSTILKVGHHGSAGSTGEEFLKAVNPKLAVISVGKKNRYGHPTKRVLDLLEKYKIPTYRTDKNGRIEIVSDGIGYQCLSC